MGNKDKERLRKAVRRFRAKQDGRYQRVRQQAEATITSVTRDEAGRATAAYATISGVAAQKIHISYGERLGVGDTWIVENAGGPATPRWMASRRLNAAPADPLIDPAVSIVAPSGLQLSYQYEPTQVGGVQTAELFLKWLTSGHQYGNLRYEFEVYRNDLDAPNTPWAGFAVDRLPVSTLAADVTNSQTVIPIDATDDDKTFPRRGRVQVESEKIDYTGATDGEGETGSGTGGTNTFTVSGAGWTANEWVGFCLIDSADAVFLIAANTATVLTAVGTPASGSYTIAPCLSGCTRGAGGTDAASHDEDAGVGCLSVGASVAGLPIATYNVRVRAHSNAGAVSAWTAWASVAMVEDTTAPATPTGMSEIGLTTTSLKLSWDRNSESDLSYYLVDVATSAGGSSITGYPAPTTSPWLIISWSFGATCYWRVKAVDYAGNESSYSAWQSATTLTPTPPDLKNPSFEDGTTSPDYWSLYDGSPVSTIWDSSKAQGTGSRSAAVSVQAADGADDYDVAFASDYVEISREAIYEIYCYCYTAATTSNVFKLTIWQYQDDSGTAASTPKVQLDTIEQQTNGGATGIWSTGCVTQFMISPEDTDVSHIRVSVEVHLDTTYAQDIWFDTFYLGLWSQMHLHSPSNDHGALTGLDDDDHPQYAGVAQAETVTGAWTFDNDVTVDGDITVTGTVDGVDVAALKTDVDGFPDELKNLTAAEIQQMENIGGQILTAATWGYLADINQSLGTGDSPTFAGLVVDGKDIVEWNAEQFVVLATSGDMPNERVLTAGDGIELVDGGPGSTITIAVDVTDFVDTSYGLTENSNNIRVNLASPSGLEFATGALRIRDDVAGDGLTISGKVLTVGAGDLISVGSNSVGITSGANWQFIGTGSGTAAGWRNVSELAGSGLTTSAGVLSVGEGDAIVVGADAISVDAGDLAGDGMGEELNTLYCYQLRSSSNSAAALTADANGDLMTGFNVDLHIWMGSLGIRTEPEYLLHIKSNGVETQPFLITSSADSDPLFYISEDANGDAIVRLQTAANDTGVLLRADSGDSYIASGNVGIGTTGPDRRADILDASNPQLRLTQTDGSVYTDFQTDAGGDLNLLPSGGAVVVEGVLAVSGAGIFVGQVQTADDTGIAFGDGNDYAIGYNSTLDSLQLVDGNTIGSNVRMSISYLGDVGINIPAANRKLEVLDDSGPQLRLSYSDGVKYTDFETDSSGDLNITPSSGGARLNGSLSVTSLGAGDSGYETQFTADADGAEVGIIGTSLTFFTYEPLTSLDVYVSGNLEASTSIRSEGLIEAGSYVQADGGLATTHTFEWSGSVSFANGVADQVSYINFGNVSVWGCVEVTLTSAFGNQRSIGRYTKRYEIGRSASGSINSQSAEVPACFGDVATQWRLGDFEVDTNDLRIPIYHVVSTSNVLIVTVRGWIRHDTYVDDILEDLTLTTPAVVTNSETRDYQFWMATRTGLGIDAPAYLLSISGDGNDQLGMTHDGTNALFYTTDGDFIFQTDEGTNTNTALSVKGKGTGIGAVRVYDQDDAEYMSLYAGGGDGRLSMNGTSPGDISIQYNPTGNCLMFENLDAGETYQLMVYGYRSGDAQRRLEIGVGVDADDTASFDGLSNYLFDGNVKADAFYAAGSAGQSGTLILDDGANWRLTMTFVGGILTSVGTTSSIAATAAWS